jgi:NAD-dependent dihydropyrimidine dehydrogenase PreA subunit
MKFDLKNPNPGVWFDLPDDELQPEEEKKTKSRICLRVCNAEALEAIDDQTIKKRKFFKKGQFHEEIEVDEKLRSRMLWDYSIIAWENLQDENGVDIPCNTDTKAALMTGSPVFVRIVSERLDVLQETYDKLARVSEKNLSSTSNDAT